MIYLVLFWVVIFVVYIIYMSYQQRKENKWLQSPERKAWLKELEEAEKEHRNSILASLPHSARVRTEAKWNYSSLVTQIGKRDGWGCKNCGQQSKLVMDHIVPVSRGGTNDMNNLQLLCVHCNVSKGNRTMDEWDRIKKTLSREELNSRNWIGKKREERAKLWARNMTLRELRRYHARKKFWGL